MATNAKASAKTAAPKAKVTLSKVSKDMAATAVLKTPRPTMSGFAEFLRDQNVVSLAIGLVIGAQVKSLTDQLIQSFINPLLGLVLPGRGSLEQQVFALHVHHKTASFAWGAFVATFLSFTTAALVVYCGFKLLQLEKLAKKKDTSTSK